MRDPPVFPWRYDNELSGKRSVYPLLSPIYKRTWIERNPNAAVPFRRTAEKAAFYSYCRHQWKRFYYSHVRLHFTGSGISYRDVCFALCTDFPGADSGGWADDSGRRDSKAVRENTACGRKDDSKRNRSGRV